MNTQEFSEQLKKSGHRSTKLRLAVMNMIFSDHGPWSVEDIRNKLCSLGLKPNKTTIYRELDLLLAEKFIQAIDFGEGKKRFEIKNQNHHHRLFCTVCKTAEEVEIEENFEEQAKQIFKNKQFKIASHALEFFGICGTCQQRTNS